ncbi:hypothetical protein MMC12_007884 [Toensbergia leucococca]|nr:hypothetical protein [Toensbergia leucococca]
MTSLPGTAPIPSWAKHLIWDATPPFRLKWITIAETRFSKVGHLKNRLNDGQAVLVGRDGQEIEEVCGRGLCEIIDEEGRLNAAVEGDWGVGAENGGGEVKGWSGGPMETTW